jgi:hypothetical protein
VGPAAAADARDDARPKAEAKAEKHEGREATPAQPAPAPAPPAPAREPGEPAIPAKPPRPAEAAKPPREEQGRGSGGKPHGNGLQGYGNGPKAHGNGHKAHGNGSGNGPGPGRGAKDSGASGSPGRHPAPRATPAPAPSSTVPAPRSGSVLPNGAPAAKSQDGGNGAAPRRVPNALFRAFVTREPGASAQGSSLEGAPPLTPLEELIEQQANPGPGRPVAAELGPRRRAEREPLPFSGFEVVALLLAGAAALAGGKGLRTATRGNGTRQVVVSGAIIAAAAVALERRARPA